MNIKMVLGLLAFTWSIGCVATGDGTDSVPYFDAGIDAEGGGDSSDAGMLPIFYWDSTADYYMTTDSIPPDMCCNVFYQDACVVQCPTAD